MSINHLLRRIWPVVGIALFWTTPATAQVSEPEFVPYVNDLQMFDQPDLSPYGQGVRMPEGWFGSAEYLYWSVQAPSKAVIGNSGIPAQAVWIPGTRTQDTGTQTLVTVTNFLSQNSAVTINAPGIPITVNGVNLTLTGTFNLPLNLRVTQSDVLVQSSSLNGLSGAIATLTARTSSSSSLIGVQFNSLDTGYINSDFTSGSRFEFGRIVGGKGWMIGSFNLGTQSQTYNARDVAVNFANQPFGFVDIAGQRPTAPGNLVNPYFLGDGYDDDLDGDGVYGRYGRDRGTQAGGTFNPPLDGVPDAESPGSPTVPIDWDDAVPLPTIFANLQITNKTSIWGTELSRMWQVGMGPRGGIWELFLGPRFISLRDQFNVLGTGDNTNPFYALNPINESYWNTSTKNNILGLQLGGRWAMQRERWQVSIESRGFAAANFQNVSQQGLFGSLYLSTVQPQNANGIPTTNTVPRYDDVINAQLPHHFGSSANMTEFAPGGELRFNLKYQVFRSVYLTMGYSGLYVHGLARANQMVRYSFPNMGILENNNHKDMFINGFNLGVVINR